MGFTERASCRPYKNCYKKSTISRKMAGSSRRSTRKSSTKKRSTRKRSSGVVSPSIKHVNHPTFIYHSEHTSYTSHPQKNSPHGKRSIVNITDGKGKKRLETLNASGKVIKANNKSLNKAEINHLKQGRYIPGLWLSV
jgi:hypothetical protein